MVGRRRLAGVGVSVALLVTGVAAVGHSAPAANPYAAACPAPEPQVRFGSSGPCVRKLQVMLNAVVPDAGLMGSGIFGPRTHAAAVAFQAANGIRSSGIVGPLTWAALGRSMPEGPAGGTPLIVNVTGFGWPDNSPANSAAIAYPILHALAGGSGTYDDPVTFAAKALPMFPKGLRLYVPYLQRYAIKEDLCGGCTDIGIDIWVGGQGGDPRRVIACEDKIFRRGVEVIKDPPPGLPVSPGPIFDAATGSCSVPGA